jgi:hypothetical protein
VLASPALAAAGGVEFKVSHSQNVQAVPMYEVFEITFLHDAPYNNPWEDVTVNLTFVSPGGKEAKVGGFHYGSLDKARIESQANPKAKGERKSVRYLFEKADTWKARFAPNELGRWKYSYTFENVRGEKATGAGEFTCIQGRAPNHGFVRPDPKNPHRWVFDDGSPYFPIGLQECLGDSSGAGSVLATASLEGPFRLDRPRADPLPGAMFKPGPSNNPQNGDTYFRHYRAAGFNLFRFSQQNCSYQLTGDLDRYFVQESIMTDELLRHARTYNMRIMYGIFGFRQVFNDHPENAEGMEQVKRFIKYSVDRWGAYADIWEFLNEQNAKDEWYAIVTPYLKSIDPYHHPVATSWERPQLPGIDVSAPHWYTGIGPGFDHDRWTADQAKQWKRFGKPVIVGEQGNSAPREQLKGAVGGVWDPDSALRMRLRNWSALFNEIAFVFWNTSYAKDGHYMNIWLGPLERQYVRAMQDFAYALGGAPGGTLRMSEVATSDPNNVRAFGLASDARAGAYLHHFANRTSPVKGLTVSLEVPRAGKAYWYAPVNGEILKSADVKAGRQTLDAPEFAIDLALLITTGAPPDSDRDGKPNDVDPDDDNDGVVDAKDAFPLEPFEWADRDGDLIGDNLDADDDADGIGDDDNKNGKPDNEEIDIDGDGVPRAEAVPWDAFPNDPKEWRDTDGDGIGDNADLDDDGDGFTDVEEKKAGTDPLDKLKFPPVK